MSTEAPRDPTPMDELAESWLDELCDLEPELRVSLGRPGREGDYADYSPDGVEAQAEAVRRMRARVGDVPLHDATDVITRDELFRTLDDDLAAHDAGMWRSDLNVIASPAQGVREIFDLVPTATVDDWGHVATRLRNVPAALDGYVATLRAGIAAGDTPAIRQVEAVADQVSAYAEADGFFATMVAGAATDDGTPLPDSLSADLGRGSDAARDAYRRFVDFLRTDLAPVARLEDAFGRDRYSIASRRYVGATVDLDETYAWGVEELRRMVAEQEAIADEILPGASVLEAVAHLEADQSVRLHGTDALQQWMQETSDRALAELDGTHFDIPEPLRRLECRIAPTQEGGIYYTGPTEDFSRPGRMWWSVPPGVEWFDPWREKTTVFHEGVPGHHLQVGLATCNSASLNAWRRVSWNSGHGEGWALYAERLMDELGYFTTPAERLGMLDGQRMRAARVVVDIGVHLGLAKPDGSGRWTGDDALPFMLEHANMPEGFVRFEVLRYLGWGGQAPSYKVGQRLWEQLRTDWLAKAGPDARVRDFHRDALAVGSIGLGTLRASLLG